MKLCRKQTFNVDAQTYSLLSEGCRLIGPTISNYFDAFNLSETRCGQQALISIFKFNLVD